MPRIRTIKPEFFQDEDLARLSAQDRLVFVGIWTQADREGRLEYRPSRLKVQIMPYDDMDMEACLDRLIRGGFLVKYEVGGRLYLLVRTFLKHQRPHKTEQTSVLPPLDNGCPTVLEPFLNGQEGKGKEGKGKEGKETPSESCRQEPTPGGDSLPEFVTIWNEVMDGSPLPTVRKWTAARDRVLKARLREEPDLAVWRRAMELLRSSPHHRGENNRGWIASVDFLLQASQAGKWLDSARNGAAPRSMVGRNLSSPAEIMAAAQAMQDERDFGDLPL